MAMIPRLLQRLGISSREVAPRPAPSDIIPDAPPQQILGVPETVPDPVLAVGSGPVPRVDPEVAAPRRRPTLPPPPPPEAMQSRPRRPTR